MCTTVTGRRESGSVVLHNDFVSRIWFTGPDQYVQRSGLRIHAMFYCILNNGLKGQWWYAEQEVRCIVVNKKEFFKLSLLYGEIGTGVL